MKKLFKALWNLISKLLGFSDKNKPSFEDIHPDHVINPVFNKKKTHGERLNSFKEKRAKDNKLHYPNITNKSYHRSYERLQAIKEHKLYLRELKLQGKGLNDKGEVINKQQPYRKDQYKSLEAYNRYARGFNYNNR